MGDDKQDVDAILNSTPDYIRKIQGDNIAGRKPFKCAVLSCPNLYHEHYCSTDDLIYKFHKFPSDPTIRETWKQLCRLPAGINPDAVMVCSEHFLLDDYERNYKEEFRNPAHRRPLKIKAVPSQKLSGAPVHYIEVVENKQPAEIKEEDSEASLRDQLKQLQRRVRLRKKSLQNLNKQIDKLRSEKGVKQRKGALCRVFSDAQIGVLRGKKKVVWSDDDLAMAFSLRHMGSRECYLYLKHTLNMPLPSLSCVQRWDGCVVFGCGSSPAEDVGLQFHTFPKDPDVMQKWLTACIWKEDVDVETSQVCSLHFPPDAYTDSTLDYNTPYTHALKETAVPTQKLIKSNELTAVTEKNPIYITPQQDYLYMEPNAHFEIKVIKDDTQQTETIQQLKDAIAKAKEEHAELSEECKEKQKIVQRLKRKRLTVNEETRLLRKVFSESQIKILNGKKMIHWTNDDMVVGYTIRHLSSKRCYLYLSKNLNIPLPGLSSIKRWATIKKEQDK